MDLMLLRIFQRQVADQCRFTLTSAPIINRAAQAGDHDELWIGCQMFVVGAANASKALWGEGKGRDITAPLRQPLRDSLEVDDTSALYDVNMRNNFEHFDERIDRWWAESTSHSIADRMIGPPNMIGGLREDLEMFRLFDPVTATIVFWGQSFELQPIAAECDRIGAIAQREADKPHWET